MVPWKIQLLLETPLLNGAERQALTEVAAKVDAALTAEVKLPTETPTSLWPAIVAPADDALFISRIQLASHWFETVADGAIPTDATSLARRERLTVQILWAKWTANGHAGPPRFGVSAACKICSATRR